MNKNYFEVTYRGLTAEVEPANDSGRWEYRLDTDGDWRILGCGCWPQVGIDAAREATVARLKERHPSELACAYRELTRATERVARLKADSGDTEPCSSGGIKDFGRPVNFGV